MVGPQHHARYDMCRVIIDALSEYTVYLLRAMGYECKTSQDLKPAETIFNPRLVDKEIRGWRVKLRDALGLNAFPIVNHTMQQRYGDALSMEEKALIPSLHEPKARANETQALMNAHTGEKDETEPESLSRVERSPYVEDVYMETSRSSPPTRRKISQMKRKD